MSESLRKIVILHTNDIHSHFEAMSKVSAVLADLRHKHAETPILTIDCGDHMDRMRMETEGSGGLANIAVMNRTGYDLAVMGNNEGLTFTMDEIEELYSRHAEFTVLGANLKPTGHLFAPDWLKPFKVVRMNGIRLGFIGLTAAFSDFYRLLGWEAEDPFLLLQRELEGWKKQADIIVILSHLGLHADKRMAEEFDGIDLILGGHTHHLLEVPLKHRNTYLAGCGKFGQYVGEIELYGDAEDGRLRHVEGRCHPTAGRPEDPGIQEVIAGYRQSSCMNLGRVVAQLESGLEIDWHGESRLGNLLAAGLRKWTQGEIGIVNAGQLLQSLLAGPVTKGRLLELCPSPINPCRLIMKGSMILQALEEALLPDFREKAVYGYGFRGKMLGGLCLDGLTVYYEEQGEPYHKIREAYVGYRLLAADEEYAVGTIDMFTFGIGYMSLKEGSDIRYFLPEFIRDVLEKELQDVIALEAAARPRWIPL